MEKNISDRSGGTLRKQLFWTGIFIAMSKDNPSALPLPLSNGKLLDQGFSGCGVGKIYSEDPISTTLFNLTAPKLPRGAGLKST